MLENKPKRSCTKPEHLKQIKFVQFFCDDPKCTYFSIPTNEIHKQIDNYKTGF